jgi:plastocyanin
MSNVLTKGVLRVFVGLLLTLSLFLAVPSISTNEALAEGSTIGIDITQGASTKTSDAYAPNPVHANVGDTVVWTNKDSTIHTATSGNPSDGPTGLFGGSASAPSLIAPATKQTFTFFEAGEYPYYCVLHPTMVGTVLVEDSSGITVKTDKPVYDFGEEITVSGKVSDVLKDEHVIVRVANDEGIPIRVDPVDVNSDGRYSYHIQIGGILFKEGAVHSVTVTYREAEATTTFRISGNSSVETCQGLLPTLVGTERNDILNGTSGADVIVGLRGNDVINGLDGNDIICGGLGMDSINGGDGDDKLLGGNENDMIDGNAGNDLIWGGTGWDRLIGGLGNDTVRGGIGNDRLFAGDGDDSLFGQEGDDFIDGMPETEDKKILAELSDTRYLAGELVVITGSIDGNDVEVGESVFVRVVDTFSNVVFQEGVEPDTDGDFEFDFRLGDDALLGIYSVGLSYVGYDDGQLEFFVTSHSDDVVNIRIEVDDEHSPGDEVEIMGSIEDISDDVDEVMVTITEPDGADNSDDVLLEDDEFSLEYHLGDPADEGIYIIEVEYDGESAFSYFLVDEEDDSVEVVSDEDVYELGEEIVLVGEVHDLQIGEEEVEIIILDPAGEEVVEEAELDDEEFEIDIDLDDAPPGRYAVIAIYDGEESGFTLFEVDEDGDIDSPITVVLSKSSYRLGEEVIIGGSVDEIEVGAEVIVTVEDPNGDELFSDSIEPANSGEFEVEFDLDDDAETGVYIVLVEYLGNDIEEILTVTSSSGSGGGSGNDDGLTAKLSKTSLLAGETLMVRGVVPRLVTDEDGVSITILNPDHGFVTARFPEPESDRSYSTSIVLPSSLEIGEDYEVIVYYDNNEVELSFDIIGKAPAGDAITVETDKASYAAGSTVTITGKVAGDILEPGVDIFLQVFNPESAPYRFDPITPDTDGSYSYSMVVGGPLGVTGVWYVKVRYADETADTTFLLTGGISPLIES